MRTYRGVHVVALGIVGEVTAFKEEDIHRLFDELYNAGQFKDLRLYNNPKNAHRRGGQVRGQVVSVRPTGSRPRQTSRPSIHWLTLSPRFRPVLINESIL